MSEAKSSDIWRWLTHRQGGLVLSHPVPEEMKVPLVGERVIPISEVKIQADEVVAVSTAPVVKETLGHKIEGDVKKFISILELVGKDAEKGLVFAAKYALPVAGLVSLLFPAVAAGATGAATALGLIQNAVLEVKAKSAALPAGLTKEQMLADEIQLVEPAVISLLAQEKITVNSAQVSKIIQAVVAILNTQPAAAA